YGHHDLLIGRGVDGDVGVVGRLGRVTLRQREGRPEHGDDEEQCDGEVCTNSQHLTSLCSWCARIVACISVVFDSRSGCNIGRRSANLPAVDLDGDPLELPLGRWRREPEVTPDLVPFDGTLEHVVERRVARLGVPVPAPYRAVLPDLDPGSGLE